MPSLMIGRTLRHYRIERPLGAGGMGEVYLAQDTRLQRLVALKILPQAATADPDRLQRFEREARAVAALNHPNVVTIFSVEEDDGLHFLTMELVDGQTLTTLLERRGFPLERFFAIAIPLVDGVAAAHERGIVHRDLKPGNVMIGADGRVKILDFGLAKLRQQLEGDTLSADTAKLLTGENKVLGTPQYMSPEQADGRPVDSRSDVFSLGVILYEMATGQRPFSGATPMSVISSIIKDTPPPVLEIRPELPTGLDRIIRRCLAKDPTRRYQSAHDLRNDLDELRQQVESGEAWTVLKPRRRMPRWVLPIAAVALLAAAAWFVYIKQRPAAADAPPLRLTFSQITSQPGVEWFPSLSPDAKWVIYSAEHSGNREIYLQSVNGHNPINLTNDPSDDDQPAFSPDGERIAFRSSRDGGGIFVMGRTGESVRKVTSSGFNPAWSPDGKQIAFSAEKMEINPQNSEGLSALFVVDVSGSAPRRLYEGDAIQANWSPNVRRIAYARRLGTARQMDIWTIPVGGGDPVPVTSDPATDWNPVWSPDGTLLYFGSDRGGSLNLWRVRIDEATGKTIGNPEPVTTPAAFLAHPTISGDGKRLAYCSALIGQNIQMLAMDPVAGTIVGDPVDITRGSRLWSSPDPSPDGSLVAFYSRVQPEGDLYSVRSDGTGFQQVTSDEAIDRVPRWSPDGRWIAFFSNRNGSLEIWKVRPDGSEVTQMTDAPVDVGVAAWSPDGTKMACGSVNDATGLYIYDTTRPWSQQSPFKVRSPRGLAPFVSNSWSPDGKKLAGTAGFKPGVFTYTIATQSFEQLTDIGEWPVWLPDSRRILFVSGGKDFFVVDSVTKEMRRIFSVTRDVLGPPRLTRDGRALYYSRRVTEGDIWLVTMH